MKYFTIKELVRSTTADKLGIDNTPTATAERNLEQLVKYVLDPLREAYGQPIKVNSGYRSPALNKAIKGANNSQHMQGQAADISVGTRYGNKDLIALAMTLELPYDQLIDEKNGQWVHISYGPRNRRQFLRL